MDNQPTASNSLGDLLEVAYCSLSWISEVRATEAEYRNKAAEALAAIEPHRRVVVEWITDRGSP